MTAVEPLHDEPPQEVEHGVQWWQSRCMEAAEAVYQLHRLVDDAVACLHEHGLHAEADHFAEKALGW